MPRKIQDNHNSECLCFKCKIKTIQLAPSATPSRTYRPQKPREHNNSWERGTPTDERGMPFIKANGDVLKQKEYSENRSKIEEHRRKLKNS